MDTGHYNCRDYNISPHIAPTTTSTNDRRAPVFRHESWEELEMRCRSPASIKPKFPLLKLPLELRQEIFSYLMPRTRTPGESLNPLAAHARNFSAVKKRGERGMHIPTGNVGVGVKMGVSNVVWQRGNTSLFCVCKQIHNEYAEMVYGRNTFLLFITFGEITFRFQWLLPSGLAPTKRVPFIELVPAKYLKLIKKAVVHLDHIDSYTAMIKFNIQGKGLTHGLRRQVQRLVDVLRLDPPSTQKDNIENGGSERRLIKLSIRVSNGNAVLDQIRLDFGTQEADDEGGVSDSLVFSNDNARTPVKHKGGPDRISDEIAEMLAPFQQLRGVREVSVSGAVPFDLARQLESVMRSTEPFVDLDHHVSVADGGMQEPRPGVTLCVYGNDIE